MFDSVQSRDHFPFKIISPILLIACQGFENRGKLIVYIGCTCLEIKKEIKKSSWFQALRQSYSVQKQYHLLKPCMITGSDGSVHDNQGP